MGLVCSWIAVKGASKEAIFEALGLVETDLRKQVFPGCQEAPFSYLEKSEGWTVVASEDFEWATRERIIDISKLGPAVGCQIWENQLICIATGANEGAELWRLSHDSDSDPRQLDISGNPPAEFAAIRDRILQEQQESDAAEEHVDYIFDIPMDAAKAVCGYRTDEEHDAFVALKRIGESDPVEEKPKRGFFASLFGGKGK